MADKEDIRQLAGEIENTREILTALGDETRQHLILVMMQAGECNGMRVNDIAEKTSLSRPAVSHHLQILKKAGIIRVRKEGTKNYYYFDADMKAFNALISMLEHARSIMSSLPDRSGEE